MKSNDEFSQYKASNFKKDEFDQYRAENYRKSPASSSESNNDVDEGFAKSLIYAPFRVAKDIGIGALHGLQKVPDLLQSATTEVPGLIDVLKNHKAHASLQALAGSQEAINSLNQMPLVLAQYANERLHLYPKAVPEFIKKITPDTTEAINSLFDKPQYPGESLIRGTVRDLPQIIPAVRGLNSFALKGLDALRPSNVLRGNLTPEQLEDNLRITQGTETGLGDVIGNPLLKRFNENVLSKIPFSGVNNALQQNAGEIISRGHSLIDQLAGNGDIENLDKHLHDALNDSYKSHQSAKNAYYDYSNKLADEEGLKLDLPEFAKKVKENKNAIEDTNILKYEPEMQGLLRKLAGYESPVKSETTESKILDEFGQPFTDTTTSYPTLKEANILKHKLNQLANQHGSSPLPSDRHLAGVFSDLAGTLKGDIKSSIGHQGSDALKNAYNTAEQNYSKNFSPFLDKQIYKFINGNADPETLLQSFIKTGKSSDRGNLISMLRDRLPFEDRNLLGYGYLQRAMDENNVLNPLKLKTLLSKNALGNKQFEALFPNPVLRNALRDYVKLVDMNTKGLKLMQNPETGQMNMDILPLISKSPASFGAKILGAPLIARKLRSEATRNSLVEKMLEPMKERNTLNPYELLLLGGNNQQEKAQ